MIGYTLTLDEPLPAGSGYPLYAFLLEQLPAEVADRLHSAADAPISQWTRGRQWQVNLLGPAACAALDEVLAGLETVTLHGLAPRRVVVRCRTQAQPLAWLEAPVPDRLQLTLQTPTAFKSKGHYQLLPTQELVVGSLVRRWNVSVPDCPIEDEGGGLQALAEGLVYRQVRLQSQNYPLKQAFVPGVTGRVEIRLQLTGFHRALAGALLSFAPWAGLGVKTALGMGGTALDPLPVRKGV